MERRVFLSGGPFDGQMLTVQDPGPVLMLPRYLVEPDGSLRLYSHRYAMARPVRDRLRVYKYTPVKE